MKDLGFEVGDEVSDPCYGDGKVTSTTPKNETDTRPVKVEFNRGVVVDYTTDGRKKEDLLQTLQFGTLDNWFPKEKKIKVTWDMLPNPPEWARFAAMDIDGDWYFYRYKPERFEYMWDIGEWEPDIVDDFDLPDIDKKNIDWTVLISKPE